MPVPNLPQMDPLTCPFAFTTSGEWVRNTAPTFLDQLVKSLAQGHTLAHVQSIDSIPQVWAKPLLFKMALFDNAHQFVDGLKGHVTGEWRSLLAMLALKDMLSLDALTVSHINLMADMSQQAQVFKNLAPQEALDGNINAWTTNTYIINFNGVPIAMTSPVTLVATAADYADNLITPLPKPWSNNGFFLTDPIPLLNNKALNALRFWLDDLQANLHAMAILPKANPNFIPVLINCVTDYIDDVKANIETPLPKANFDFQPSSLNLAPLLGGLLKNTVKSVSATTSDVKLVLHEPTQSLLLVSTQMLQSLTSQTGIPLANIEVWEDLMANSITAASLQKGPNKIANKTLPPNVEFRCPEKFFNDKMVLLSGSNVFCNSLDFKGRTGVLSNSKYTAILPIKPELAKIFSTEEIKNRISISYDDNHGNAKATLTFKFPLSGKNKDGHQIEYQFEKVYSEADNTLIKATTDIPVVEIWPDFICDKWKTYYLHYSNNRAEAATAVNVKPSNICFFSPWSSEDSFETDAPIIGATDIFTSKMNRFPEALSCTYFSTQGIPIEAGMIFLNKPKQIDLVALNWKVGIDFGTSATMIFYSQNDGEPQPLNLKSHLYQITNSNSATRTTRNTLNFISNDDSLIRDGSFLSVFHLLNHKVGLTTIEPLQDGHVLLLTSNSPYHKNPKYANFIDTNIKWNIPRKLKAYINQICMQVLVEALSNGISTIDWNFSYPLAFTTNQKNSFIANCTAIPVSIGHSCNSHSESEALAYYFNALNNGILGDSICIDIGAGTTDISIISGAPNKIIFHTSIQYAGRHMFNSIYENFSLFAPNRLNYNNALTNNQEQATIDLDMRDNSDNYIANLPDVVVDEKTATAACRTLQLAQLAVAGLFYYIGKILKALHDKHYYKSGNLPQVFIGGNGSRIFKWLAWDADINTSSYTSVFKDILSSASGLQDSNIRFTLSEKPKIEVASGMISTIIPDFYDNIQMNKSLSSAFNYRYSPEDVIAGVAFSTDSAHSAEEFLTALNIQQGVTIDNLDEFENFIETFNKSYALYDNGIKTKNPNYKNVLDRVKRATCGFYNNQKGQPDLTQISVEPVFIVELREFIKNVAGLL